MLISAERIHEIFHDCLFREGEPHEVFLPARGLTMNVGLHPQRTESYADEIHSILLNLPDEFQEKSGGGYTFMNMVLDKDGNHCMEQMTAQELLMLGLATGWACTPMPRELWAVLPGGVPYIMVYENRQTVEPIKSEEVAVEV